MINLILHRDVELCQRYYRRWQALEKTVNIQIDTHTLERAEERGTSEKKIKDVIESGLIIPVKYGRKGKAKVYKFGQNRHGKFYEQKRVEVIYVIEDNIIITVTVYVFYGKWEE